MLDSSGYQHPLICSNVSLHWKSDRQVLSAGSKGVIVPNSGNLRGTFCFTGGN